MSTSSLSGHLPLRRDMTGPPSWARFADISPMSSNVNCSYLASHFASIHSFRLPVNPDISGLGVILSFLLSAYMALLFTFVAYWSGMISPSLLNSVDRRVFQARFQSLRPWRDAFRKGMRAVSDTQLVTGLAILISSFSTLPQLSVYHWNCAIYLAWMSSNVHLTTLSVIRGYAGANQYLRIWRLIGMITLFALLFAALVPMATKRYHAAMPLTTNFFDADYDNLNPGDPVHCFWDSTAYWDGFNLAGIVSLLSLVGTYVWKLIGTFEASSSLMREWVFQRPRQYAFELIERIAIWRNQQHSARIHKFTWLPLSWLIGLYALLVALCDLAQSFAASLWILSFQLVWGTIHVVLPYQANEAWADQCRSENLLESGCPEKTDSQWTFGQLLPMVLLAVPVMAVLEEFSVTQPKVSQSRKHPSYQIPEPLELQQLPATVPPSDLNTPDPSISSTARPLPHIFSDLSRDKFQSFLYSSKFFMSLLLLLNAFIMTVAIFFYFLLSAQEDIFRAETGPTFDRPAIYAFYVKKLGFRCLAGLLGLEILVVAPMSRLSR